jgi:hypothetical protein
MAYKTLTLFIDESGDYNSAQKKSGVYVLCGCSVSQYSREDIKNYADHIKFKYWGKTNIILHSREIGKNTGEFKIFRDKPELRENFIEDLLTFLNKSPILIFPILVDMEKANAKGWNKDKVASHTAHKLIYHFLSILLSDSKSNGKVIIESSTSEKDKYYLKAFSYFLSPNIKEFNISHIKIKDTLTSISFVTKNNHDIEEQIADIFAYASECKFFRDRGVKTFEKNTYEDRIISILENKLFKMAENLNEEKKKFQEKIEPFCILPV